MSKQTLTQSELDAMVASMEQAYDDEYGPEVEIETVDDEDDGQPSEYDEWQDYMGGDEYYDHSESGDYFDGGVDF